MNMSRVYRSSKKLTSTIIILSLILIYFFSFFILPSEKVGGVSGQDLIISSEYTVTGTETWDDVWIKNNGQLILYKSATLKALNIILEAGSSFEARGGKIVLINFGSSNQVKFGGSCDSFICSNGTNIEITAPDGGNLLSNCQGGEAELNISASNELLIENSSIDLTAGDGYDLLASTTSNSRAWTSKTLSNYVSAGGNATIALELTSIVNPLKINNSFLNTTGGSGGDASDGADSSQSTGWGGGYSNGGNVSGHVGAGGIAKIWVKAKNKVQIVNSTLKSIGSRGGNAGDGGDGGNCDYGGGGGGYCGGNGGPEYAAGFSGGVSGSVGIGGYAVIQIFSNEIQTKGSTLRSNAGSGGSGGNGGDGGYGVGSGGGGGGYGGAGAGGFGIRGHGASGTVTGHVGAGGNAEITVDCSNSVVEDTRFYSLGGTGGMAGNGGDPGEGPDMHGQGGGGGYGGGGGGSSIGDGGCTIVRDQVATGGAAIVNFNIIDHFTIKDSMIDLRGGAGGDGGVGGISKGTASGAGGGGIGGGGGGEKNGGVNNITGKVCDGGNVFLKIQSDSIQLDNEVVTIIPGSAGYTPDSPGGGPGGGEGKGRITYAGVAELDVPIWKPNLISPLNNNISLNKSMSFTWDESKTIGLSGNFIDYNLQIDNDINFNSPEYNTVTTMESYIPPIPFKTGVYYWRVRSNYEINFEDVSIWSDTWTFKILDQAPEVIDIKKSSDLVYRNKNISFYINGTDYHDSESKLKCSVQYKSPTGSWTDITDFVYVGNAPDGYWKVTYKPSINAEIGYYMLRCKFLDTENNIGKILYDSFYVDNNFPEILNVTFSKIMVYRTEPINIFVNATDEETWEFDLFIKSHIKEPSGNWSELFDKIYIEDYWKVYFAPHETMKVGRYDFQLEVIDEDGNSSAKKIYAQIFEVKNNPPWIYDSCDDFKVFHEPLEIDLVIHQMDVEDDRDDMNWTLEQSSVDTSLFDCYLSGEFGDTLYIEPKENVSGVDDITLILTDRDGDSYTKSDVTIQVNSILKTIYDVTVDVDPDKVLVEQGETFNVTLTIRNIGEKEEDYIISYNSNYNNVPEIEFSRMEFGLYPKNDIIIHVQITIPEDMTPRRYEITFYTSSDNTMNSTILDLTVEEKVVKKPKNGDVNDYTTTIGIVFIIILIIVITLLLYFSMVRKRKEQRAWDSFHLSQQQYPQEGDRRPDPNNHQQTYYDQPPQNIEQQGQDWQSPQSPQSHRSHQTPGPRSHQRHKPINYSREQAPPGYSEASYRTQQAQDYSQYQRHHQNKPYRQQPYQDHNEQYYRNQQPFDRNRPLDYHLPRNDRRERPRDQF